MFDLSKIDNTWTLFLDRDGVINEEKHLSYIFHYDEFRFMPGIKEAISQLSNIFGRIIIVTNQRGIGKGLMTDDDLSVIHNRMKEEIFSAGGKINAIYYCSSMDNDHEDRKPNPGMALKAQKDFMDIDLNKSVMVGNNLSDMEFGKNAGMFTVHVRTTHPDISSPHPLIDVSCQDLPEFADRLVKYVA